jgi:hypothetical protein
VYLFRQQGPYAFSSAVFYDEDSPDLEKFDERAQFEAWEDVQGIERTLVARSTGRGLNMETVEVVPMADQQNALDFREFGISADERTIRYGKNPPPECMQVRVGGLDVLKMESARACVRASGQSAQQFAVPVSTYLRRTELIRVDKLRNQQGDARTMEDHLRTLFAVVADSFSARHLGVECGYQYRLGVDGPEASLSIALIRLFDPAADGNITELVSFIKQWYRAVLPADGAFSFGLTLYGARTPQSSPALSLSRLLLPTEAILDLNR